MTNHTDTLRRSERRSQSRVADFMMHDTNADQEISFAEFVEMDKKQDLAGTNNHPRDFSK